MHRLLAHALALLAALLILSPAAAQVRVEITGVGSNQFPLSVASFRRDGDVPQPIDDIIRADLQRSGLFRLIDAGPTPLSEVTTVSLPEFRGRGADALVVGSVGRLADGRFDLRFRLYDTVKQTQLDALSYVSPAGLRLCRSQHGLWQARHQVLGLQMRNQSQGLEPAPRTHSRAP